MNKKVISVILCIAMTLTCLVVGAFTTNAAAETAAIAQSGSTAAQDSIQGSAILHCFNWSYNSIKSNLSAIKAAGYTAVQTSPVQPAKDYSSSYTDQKNQWWKLYQPIDLAVADSGQTWLGSKAELKSLCTEAEKYNIKVICDIVSNHLGDVDGSGNVTGNISSQNKSPFNSGKYFHMNGLWASSDNNRYNLTQGSIGQPDLNTGDSYVQQRCASLLKELVGMGVDGFRFDAAKHIELPSDSSGASQFWPTVLNAAQGASGNEIYFYGEILNYAGTDISNYTEYMSITDNQAGDRALVSANNSNASGLANSTYNKGADADKTVLWVESHDTYMGSSGSGGLSNTSGVSDANVIKAWAIVASRADSSSLFFARPASSMGSASSNTTWKSTAVAEVNKFKNFFEGESESLSSSGNVAYNERGIGGVVISKLDGGGSVSLTAHKMANGTYTDHVSGGKFTVSNGIISGNVGSSGVAVVYNETPVVQPTTTTPATTQPATTQPMTQPAVNVLTGDTNQDGRISISDATEVQRHIAGMIALTGNAFTAADVNGDNSVDIRDATCIMYYIVEYFSASGSCGKYTGGSQPSTTQPSTTQPSTTQPATTQPATTQPTTQPQGNYIYAKGYTHAYFWSDSNTNMMTWPGKAMESVGNSVYRAEIPTGATKVVFSNNGSNQTGDLTIPSAGMLYNNGSWSNYSGGSQSSGNNVYFDNSSKKWSSVYAYFWSSSNTNISTWPGNAMTKSSGNIYVIAIPDGATKVVFSNNGSDQTADLDIKVNGTYNGSSWQ